MRGTDATSVPAAPLAWTDGQLEVLKWIAMASMFVDHFGRHLLGWGQETWVFGLGRIAFPLFAFVLGLNLARPGDRAARADRTAWRLALWCAVAQLPAVWARGEPQTVNVLGTLALGSALCWAIASQARLVLRILACLAVAVMSEYVEFGLVGVFLVGAVFLAQSERRTEAVVLAVALFLAVAWQNASFGGGWGLAGTLACAPIAWGVRQLPLALPRLQLAFYLVYPVHLAFIGALKGGLL